AAPAPPPRPAPRPPRPPPPPPPKPRGPPPVQQEFDSWRGPSSALYRTGGVHVQQRVGETSDAPRVTEAVAPRRPERLRSGVMKRVEQRELRMVAGGDGESKALGEWDRVIRHPMSDQHVCRQTRDHRKR